MAAPAVAEIQIIHSDLLHCNFLSGLKG